MIKKGNKNYSSLLSTISMLACVFFLPPISNANDEISYIVPTYIRTITNPYEQYNDVNPDWSGDGKYVSFERYDMKTHNIILSDVNGKKIKTIVVETATDNEMDFLFSAEAQPSSFNTGISWSPETKDFVFISSGKTNNFDLFIGKTESNKTRRLTFHPLKDNQAMWSPINNKILFVSSRDGNAGVYIIDATTSKLVRLLETTFNALHPVWSPDGNKVALMLGKNSLYSIYVVHDLSKPSESLQKISGKSQHNIRPSWSADGKKLAYFSYSEQGSWDISVADITQRNLTEKTVATNVVQNTNQGPAWLPDNKNIAYIKNDPNAYNPIFIVDIEKSTHGLFLTKTKMNMDLAVSSNGVLAFQSQERQWSRVFIAGIPGFRSGI